jgi:hypothetical protein
MCGEWLGFTAYGYHLAIAIEPPSFGFRSPLFDLRGATLHLKGGRDKGLVSGLVKASGGHIRQLMQMTAVACRTAASQGHQQIQPDDVTYAIKQEQFNFERVIPVHHYPLLVQVCQLKRINQNEDGQKMLFNTSVLEYNGDRRFQAILSGQDFRSSSAFMRSSVS